MTEPGGEPPPGDSPPQAPEPPAPAPAEAAQPPGAAAPAQDVPSAGSLWAGILRTPLRRGVVHITLVLFLVAAGAAWLEGGATKDERQYRSYGQILFLVPALVLLGAAARRVTLCTAEERDIPPWSDARDEVRWWTAAGHFLVVIMLSLAPLFLWTSLNAALHPPGWLTAFAVAVCLTFATLHFPFALASVTIRSDPLGALPNRSLAAWRTDRSAAKIAIAPSFAFFALTGLAIAVSSQFNPYNEEGQKVVDETTLRTIGRVAMFLFLAGASWAALVSAKVAGLLLRDVPAIREVLEK